MEEPAEGDDRGQFFTRRALDVSGAPDDTLTATFEGLALTLQKGGSPDIVTHCTRPKSRHLHLSLSPRVHEERGQLAGSELFPRPRISAPTWSDDETKQLIEFDVVHQRKSLGFK